MILCRRKNFAKASSVSLLPRLRIRDITSERLALVKTSGIQRFPEISGQRETPFHFIRFMRVHLVVKSRPLGVAWIHFFVRQFSSVRATPRFGGEAFQNARPAAVRIFKSVGMQTWKQIGHAAPCAQKCFV